MKEPHKIRIDKILTRYKSGQLNADQARERLNKIYQRENVAWIILASLSLFAWMGYIITAFVFN